MLSLISRIIEQYGYAPLPKEYHRKVDIWASWYSGNVEDFHHYIVYQSGRQLRRRRAGLNMAKTGCEYWANLLWNDEASVSLNTDNDANELLHQVLDENDFTRQTNQLTEKAFALGQGAFIPFMQFGRLRIDYINNRYIFPLTTENDNIINCVFAGRFSLNGIPHLYIMAHERQEDRTYKVTNKYYQITDSEQNLIEIGTPTGMLESYTMKNKSFMIIKPNVANNFRDLQPLGISIFANAIDVLRAIDLAFDGMNTAMEIGRPRIGVTSGMMRPTAMGELVPIFDERDIAVYDLGVDASEGKDTVYVKDLTVPYRASEYEKSLENALLLYSQVLGLGERAFTWRTVTRTTATQVVAEDGAMLRSMEKHQEGLRTAITELVRGVLELLGLDYELPVTVKFDDSITRNRTAETAEAWAWVQAGKYPFWKFLVDFKGYDEKDAKSIQTEADNMAQQQQQQKQLEVPTKVEEIMTSGNPNGTGN